MSIKRNLGLNGTAVLLHKSGLALQHLLLVPFFLSAWGATLYGEWLTLSAIPAALAFCNLGLGSAAANSFVLRFLGGDLDGAARAMRAGQALLIGVMVLGTLVTAGLLGILHATRALEMLHVSVATASWAVALLGASSLLNVYNQLNDGWFRAARRAHLALGWEATGVVVRIAVLVGLLVTGHGLLWIAGAEVLLSGFSALGLRVIGRRLLPGLDLRSARIDRGELGQFFRKGFAFMMEPLRRSIYLQGTIVVTRIALGAEAVAVLATLRTLANSVSQLPNSIQAITFPELQYALANHSASTARRIFRLTLGASGAATLAGILALALLGPWIYAKWTSSMLNPPSFVWPLLLGGVCANAAWWPAAATFRAVNQPERYAYHGLGCACLCVAITALLVGPLGINGALSGLMIMEMGMAVVVLPAACRIVGQPLLRLPADIFALRHDLIRLVRKRSAAGVG